MANTDNFFTKKNVFKKRTGKGGASGQQYRLAKRTGSATNESVPKATRYVMEENGLAASSACSSSGDHPARQIVVNEYSAHPKCICYRDSCVITCANLHCTWTGVGRVRSLCTLHPTVTFLLDLPQCPRCLSGLREIPDRPIQVDGRYNVDGDL